SLARILGAMPPPTYTPPVARAWRARLPASVGDQTLPAHVTEALAQPTEDVGLFGIVRRVVGVAALRWGHAVPRAVPVEDGFAEPGTGGDQSGVRTAVRHTLVQDREAIGGESCDTVGRRLEVVEKRHSIHSERLSEPHLLAVECTRKLPPPT